MKRAVFVFLLVFCMLVFVVAFAKETFIQGMEYDISYYSNSEDSLGLYNMKFGDVLSNEHLDVLAKSVKNPTDPERTYHFMQLHIVPHQVGRTLLGGVYWEILPREEMPEELLGTWEITDKNNNKTYFTFHPDGRVFCYRKPSSGYTANQEMLQYAYSQGKVKFSTCYNSIGGMDVKDGILIPDISYMKGKPKHIADGKVSRMQSCSIRFYKSEKLPDTVLVDTSPDASPNMSLPIYIQIKPSYPIDPSMVFSFSDPEVAEVSAYYAWTLSIRGKKPGTTELTVQPDHKKGKASNTITIKVLEGEKTLPEELVGIRWIGTPRVWPEKTCIIFDRNGRYIYFEKGDNSDDYLVVYAGSYLYRDGVIQIGPGDEEHPLDPGFLWLFEDEADGQKVLKGSMALERSGIYLTSEPLSTENEYFPSRIIPAVDSSDWDELWMYCRYNHNYDLNSK